jgi:hypothetical protein
MWPSALIAGMLLLLGAVGSMNAPAAFAADGELCRVPDPEGDGFIEGITGSDNQLGIQGPFPNYDGYSDVDTQDHNLLLVGKTYLFAIVVEDEALDGEGDNPIDVQVDDEEGDADIESYADANGVAATGVTDGAQTFLDLPGSGVDNVDQIDNYEIDDWNSPGSLAAPNAFTEGLLEDWDVPSDPLSPDYYDVTPDTVVDCDPDDDEDDGFSFISVTCDEAGEFEISAWEDDVTDNVVTNDYICYNAPTTATLTATPTTVEAVPAVGNISHSLLVLTLTDAGGNPTVPGYRVDWTVGGRCTIEALDEEDYEDAADLWGKYKITNPATGDDIEYEYSDHDGITASDTSLSFNIDGNTAVPGYQPKSIAAAVLHCEGATPGVASVRAEVDRSPLSDLVATADVTVVGPAAFITMTAAPNKLICGEKATILVTVTDAINQKVSDHTVVELITNFGGVIGGTGATLAFPGVNPVTPLSSGAAETFGGVATAYLLTSTTHVGSYEVVASAGGSHLGEFITHPVGQDFSNNTYFRQGYFSTPVVTSQVTVTCTQGAPAVTAPSTGTGTISPPNTGDAGLAAGSSTNATLYVIAGAIAFVMAGLASIRCARR